MGDCAQHMGVSVIKLSLTALDLTDYHSSSGLALIAFILLPEELLKTQHVWPIFSAVLCLTQATSTGPSQPSLPFPKSAQHISHSPYFCSRNSLPT